MNAVLLVALVVAAAPWALAFVADPPRWTRHTNAWGVLAFSALVVSSLVLPLFASRQATVAGVVLELSAGWIRAAQALTLLTLIGTAVAVLGTRTVLGPGVRVIVGAMWALAGADVLSGLVAGQVGEAQPALTMAAVLHAFVVSVPSVESCVRWCRIVLRGVVGGSLLYTLIFPTTAFIGTNLAGELDRTLFGIPRLSGMLGHPGTLATFATLSLFFEVAMRGRFAWWWATAASVCILLAQSRTLWLVAVLGLIAMLAIRRPSTRIVAGALAIGAAILVMFRPALVYTTDWTMGSENIRSGSGRTVIWDYSLQTFADHPWIGYGPGFLGADHRAEFLPSSLQFMVHSHNQVVQTLAQNGLLGLVVLVVLVVAACSSAWKIRSNDGGLGITLMLTMLMVGAAGVPLRGVGASAVPPVLVFGYLCVARRAWNAQRGGDAAVVDGQRGEPVSVSRMPA